MSDIRWIDNAQPERVEVYGLWPFRYRTVIPAVPAYKWIGVRESDGRVLHEIATLPIGVWVSRKNDRPCVASFGDADSAKRFCEDGNP